MSQKYKNIVQEIIDECVNHDVSFTEYDIIPEAIKRGCKIDGYKLSQIVKKAKFPIYYELSTVNVDGYSFNLYHSSSVDIKKYDHSDIVKYLKKNKKHAIIIDKKIISNGKTIRDIMNDVNTNKIPTTIGILKKDVVKAGFVFGESVFFTLSENSILMTEIPKGNVLSKSGNINTGYAKITEYGAIRIKSFKLVNYYKRLPEILSINVKNRQILVKIK